MNKRATVFDFDSSGEQRQKSDGAEPRDSATTDNRLNVLERENVSPPSKYPTLNPLETSDFWNRKACYHQHASYKKKKNDGN